MTALIVIGIIVLLIAGIMLVRATVYIDYRDEVRLTVAVAGIKIKILPKKEPKPIDPNDYSPKKFKKLLKKKEKQERKKRKSSPKSRPRSRRKKLRQMPTKSRKPLCSKTSRLSRILLLSFSRDSASAFV